MTESKDFARKAKTERGETVIAKVSDAAVRLLKDRWVSDISISALAKEAGVVRASLFFQFERGWPDIAATLASSVLFREFDDILISRLDGRSYDDPVDCIVNALHSFLNLAEESGRLVQNLRSQMFVWGQENDKFFHLPSQDFSEQLAETLALAVGPRTDAHRDSAEMLINFGLDIAGGAGMYPWTMDERRSLIRSQVAVTLLGLRVAVAEVGTSVSISTLVADNRVDN